MLHNFVVLLSSVHIEAKWPCQGKFSLHTYTCDFTNDIYENLYVHLLVIKCENPISKKIK
jgi:hypothetical protein